MFFFCPPFAWSHLATAFEIVSTERIIAEGYERNVTREIAILRQLSHPGIARMVDNGLLILLMLFLFFFLLHA